MLLRHFSLAIAITALIVFAWTFDINLEQLWNTAKNWLIATGASWVVFGIVFYLLVLHDSTKIVDI